MSNATLLEITCHGSIIQCNTQGRTQANIVHKPVLYSAPWEDPEKGTGGPDVGRIDGDSDSL